MRARGHRVAARGEPHRGCRLLGLLGLLVLAGCEPPLDAIEYDWSLPEGVAPPPTPPDNPQTPEKVELGRHLFYDLRLSKNENRACGTCHEQKKAFTDGFHRAVGTDNDLHGHNTLTLTNTGYRRELGWTDMSVRTLEQQLLVPLLGDDPIEMGMGGSEAQLLAFLASDPDYAELFAAAFPDAAEPVTLDNLARSIAAFERTILSVDAPLDRYLRGDDAAISDAAKRGWELFRSPEVGCDRCHGGPDFASPTDGEGNVIADVGYYNIGLYDLDGNGSYPESAQGLLAATGVAADMGRFRIPTLRNLAYTKPFMHDGSVISLEAAIDILAAGGRNVQSGPFAGDGRGNPYKSEMIEPIELSDEQRADLLDLRAAVRARTREHARAPATDRARDPAGAGRQRRPRCCGAREHVDLRRRVDRARVDGRDGHAVDGHDRLRHLRQLVARLCGAGPALTK